MTDYKSIRDAELHTALLQSTAELAGLAVDISLQRLIRCLRKAYHPTSRATSSAAGRHSAASGWRTGSRQATA